MGLCWSERRCRLLVLAAAMTLLGGCPSNGGGGGSSGPPTWLRVSAGDAHTCALSHQGEAWCWGGNWEGELGNDDMLWGQERPVLVVGGLAQVVSLSAGVGNSAHTCAVVSGGGAWCWGSNRSGELGDALRVESNYPTPVPVTYPEDFTQISAGDRYSCGVRTDGTAWCWGQNTLGKLGDGSTDDRNLAVQVNGLTDVAEVQARWDRTCARTNAGAIWCWGFAADAGDSTSVPVAVTLPGSAVDLGVGEGHVCAVLADHTVYCWGGNNAGQLGDGSTATSLDPVQVSGITDGAEVVAGMRHTCALRTSGAISCWGSNYSGQIGDGTTNDSNSPVAVGLARVRSLTAGRNHTCAVTDDDEAWCWGDNTNDQLGDGSGSNRSLPVAVLAPR